MSTLVAIATDSFDRAVLAAPHPTAVLFSAVWCGPCRTFGPLLQRVTAALGLELAKVDVDASPELAARYGVRSVPTLLVLRAGEVVARSTGTMSEAALRRFVAALT